MIWLLLGTILSLSNPSFETLEGGFPVGWTSPDRDKLEVRADGGRSGDGYLRFVDEDGGNIWLESRWQPVRPGGDYMASAWFRTEERVSPFVYLIFYSASGRRVGRAISEKTHGPTDAWRQLSISGQAPENAVFVSVLLYASAGERGIFDIDDVSLEVTGGGEPLPDAERAVPGSKKTVDIGSRRELFVDDFMIDDLTPILERRLHHPVPQNIILELDQPWEGDASAYLSVVEVDGRVRIYYNARPLYPRKGRQTTCVIESEDGISFHRPELGMIEHDGSTANNMLFRQNAAGHNFTPFLDPNPEAPPAQRFKSVAYHPSGGGLGVWGSADGYHWQQLKEERIITKGAFDSQNLAFWDPLREQYVCYYRGPDPRGPSRGIWRATSEDFLTWSEPEPIDYMDERLSHMYTNVIRPYPRAPHLYLGTPARYVSRRTKYEDHPVPGISDAVLMSSRDGLLFERWAEGWIRPGPEPEVWTDRNNYPAWGMVQTSPTELSLYWTEHYRHPTMRFRRGTIRVDGFVSICADGDDSGELLTRPFTFAGSALEINYSTSAVGSIQVELCHLDGRAIDGFEMYRHGELFGNDIAHRVQWKNGGDLASLVGQPVRLRFRLHDADLFSFRFTQSPPTGASSP